MNKPLPEPHEYEALGRALRALRQTAGLTQVEAAQKLEVRSQFLSEVERGKRGMRWHRLRALLAVYGANLHDLGRALDG